MGCVVRLQQRSVRHPLPLLAGGVFVGSEVCVACPGCEAIQIVTKTTGRVYCKNKKAEVLPLPECYFLPEGKDRLEFESKPTLPDELCPW